jgi:hypothetical protein
MKKNYLLYLFTALLVSNNAYSQFYHFYDDFEQYSTEYMLACQNPVDWTTWNLNPCDSVEDSYVTNAYGYIGPNSFVSVGNNDEVHCWGPYTTGHWDIYFYNYIPSGKSGYFNTLATFPWPYEWGLMVHFYPVGIGWIDAGGLMSANFEWIPDIWILNEVIVDLDSNQAEYWYNGTMVHQWQWTRGYDGLGISLQIAANDFFAGELPSNEMYVDDYNVCEGCYLVPAEANVLGPTKFNLFQNYPNPFNPSTTIKYQIPEISIVTLIVYDVLGNEVATLVNEEKPAGSYEVEFNSHSGLSGIRDLSSGIYFYQLKVGSFVETKKMILLK